MFTADAIVPVTTLLIGVIVGAAGLAAVQWARGETAFTKRFSAALAEMFAKYRTQDGGQPGVLLAFDLDAPDWWLRRQAGVAPTDVPWAGVVPVAADRRDVTVLDRQAPTWPTGREPGAHRVDEQLLTADTCQIGDDRLARVLREAGR
jgi:hypothetical protein